MFHEHAVIINTAESGEHEIKDVQMLLPSSAFWSHSTNFFICSKKTLFPLAPWASLYHFKMASSLRTSAEVREKKT